MVEIDFETDLAEIGGKMVFANFSGTFSTDGAGAIEKISLDAYELDRDTRCYTRTGKHQITGVWFVAVREILATAYADQINEALQDLRDSAAASKADRDRDALCAA